MQRSWIFSSPFFSFIPYRVSFALSRDGKTALKKIQQKMKVNLRNFKFWRKPEVLTETLVGQYSRSAAFLAVFAIIDPDCCHLFWAKGGPRTHFCRNTCSIIFSKPITFSFFGLSPFYNECNQSCFILGTTTENKSTGSRVKNKLLFS